MFLHPIPHDFPVGPAAGHAKALPDVQDLSASAAAWVMVGSITVDAREGNPGNTWNNESLNAIGLRNPGLSYIKKVGREMIAMAHQAMKPIFMSAAGFKPEEFLELAMTAEQLGFDGVELNYGCPNITDNGKRKPIFSFNPPLMREVTGTVIGMTKVQRDFYVSIKLSPMSNPLEIITLAEMAHEVGVDGVVVCNTFPNALAYGNNGRPVIDTPDGTGLAGFSGSNYLEISVGQVRQYRAALDNLGASNIDLWGVGGVASADDVRQHKLAGADYVQVGTDYFRAKNAGYFSQLALSYLKQD